MKTSTLCILTFLSITTTYFNISAFSLNTMLSHTKEKIVSLFGANTTTEIIQQDIPRSTQKTLVIENSQGMIKIKTDWNQNNISFKALKKASKENLAKISIQVDTSDPDSIRVTTLVADASVQGSVDYTLMVPKHMAIRLKTKKGTIKVKRFDGQVWATTDNGTIEIAHVTHKIFAQVTDNGSIKIEKSNGAIQATANNGNIWISDTKQSVAATTGNGSIDLRAASVPSTSSINLSASGTLQVSLPHDTNAHVVAHTKKGKILSDHYVTLAPQTTKLNPQAWSHIQKNIEGILGSGEADIKLSSSAGSIKIFSDNLAYS